LFAWGLNNHGQLGIGNKFDTSVPTKVSDLDPFEGDYIVEVAGGEHHSTARTNEGLVYCWGRNDEGQLGLGDTYGDWRKKKKEKEQEIERQELLKKENDLAQENAE
jgi:alpha-tubulin suppressor-like RCC1 family protein